ncbi:MAG: hypothetical protein GX446_10750 [Chthonomonadales bacterium]|nr:hypothetical protein [Chthonomonadales bacterium]
MTIRLFLAAWAMFLGTSLAAIALDCYGDPRLPEIRSGGKCHEGFPFVYCTDDELVYDGACKVATTGAAHCTVSNYVQYHTWKPKHPGYFGFGYCENETDCEKENSYWSHLATNSGTCKVSEE